MPATQPPNTENRKSKTTAPSLPNFHPLVQEWFDKKFDSPTDAQTLGWPHIAANRNTLIAAPTGSGKTLAAFLVCLDQLFWQATRGELEPGVQVVYISPLRALSNDIERNLHGPLSELRELSIANDVDVSQVRVGVRTSDTTSSQRQTMLRRPPHILVTTPESLYLLLTAEKSREMLRTVRTVIVDEIHALARDKRGSHLALSLERLEQMCVIPPVRIGLSATQRPMEQIAEFLVGGNGDADSDDFKPRPCEVIDIGHVRHLDLAIETPESDLEAVCSLEQWVEVYERLARLIQKHRSTLVFVNTRRLAERVALAMIDLLGEDAVASHHGSLSKDIRLSAEQRLKDGKLKAIVATASLEMGIDIGYIDLVAQIGSPRAIATFLQRVGRSGHSIGATPKGRIFPLTRDQLLECMALVRAVKNGDLDSIEIPEKPRDILAQQIIASVAGDATDEDALFAMCRRAYPYRHLTRDEFDEILDMTSEGVAQKRGAYLHRDRINDKVRARRGARLAAITSGGAIPDTAEYRVVTQDERTFVGTVDEDFAIESLPGDVFILGNTSWRIMSVRGGEVTVNDAQGAPPSIPFWFGEAPGRTIELSRELSNLRKEIGEKVTDAAFDSLSWLQAECGVNEHAAGQANKYIHAQKAALGLVPSIEEIVFERFFDESGGMQLVIHAPLGARINRAWGLALRKRFCRSFDFELQAAADDNGVVLSLSPQHSFPVTQLFTMLDPSNAQYLLEQAVLAAPMFQVRWRWNVTRALAVLRMTNGKKTPPHLLRFRSEDLLAACFPETVGCLENHHGDVEIPDQPLVKQTMEDCLTEAMDIKRWIGVLRDVKDEKIAFIDRDTREPSPFCHELLNANPYAFLDDAPLEERRSRAVQTRRTLSVEALQDLARLDSEAIAQVCEQAWPYVRNADELHDAMLGVVLVQDHELGEWRDWMPELVAEGRATRAALPDGGKFWIVSEHTPLVAAVYEGTTFEPPIELPRALQKKWERSDGWIALVRGRVSHSGPISTKQLADLLHLDVGKVFASLEALEGEGLVLRGRFTGATQDIPMKHLGQDLSEWCERRLLARIHRLTLEGLRRRIQPVGPETYLRFLAKHHHILGEQAEGPGAVRDAVTRLQGFELPAAAWEKAVLASRVAEYDKSWLDELFMSGEVVWGRLRTPKRDEKDEPTFAAMTRVVPLTLMLRDDLPQLCSPRDDKSTSEESNTPILRGNAQDAYNAIASRGALFFQEIAGLTQMLPTHLEEALRELAALGLVTSDGFGAVRAIVADGSKKHRNNGRSFQRSGGAMGRWSHFPGILPPCDTKQHLEKWCHQLLARYGVVFRDVLTREFAAPRWYQLAPVFRHMELRGGVRGGRFVSGVAGEQFATEKAVQDLRRIRDEEPTGEWFVISGADPLNLTGIITDDARITAGHKNKIIMRDGRCIAALQAGEFLFFTDVSQEEKNAMTRALQTDNRRTRDAHQHESPASGLVAT